MTKQLEKLMNRIADAQIKYHVTGGYHNDSDIIAETHETKNGTTIRYRAGRICACRGLSYRITKTEISIARGVKETYIGTTHEFGRETVSLI